MPTITTNAGLFVPLSEKLARERKERNVDVVRKAVARAQEATAKHGGVGELAVQSANSPVIVPRHHLTETEADIRRMEYLQPGAIIEDPSWPDGTGLRKELSKFKWEAILVHGLFCFKCRWRLKVPFQWKCHRCGWTQDMTSNAVAELHRRGFIKWYKARKQIRAGLRKLQQK